MCLVAQCFAVETEQNPPILARNCLSIFFLFSDGNITDDIFLVQIHDQEDGEQFKSVFHWDMKSKDKEGAPNRQPLANEVREKW